MKLLPMILTISLCFSTTTAFATKKCARLFALDLDVEYVKLGPFTEGGAKRVNVRYDGRSNVVVLNFDKRIIKKIPDDQRKSVRARIIRKGGRVVKTSKREDDPLINCHAYACLVNNVPGLVDGWISGRPEAYAFNENPLNNLLKLFFKRITSYDPQDTKLFENDNVIRENDLIAFINRKDEFVHSGIVVYRDHEGRRQNWVRSKFGALETFEVSIDEVAGWFPHSQIEVWRRK